MQAFGRTYKYKQDLWPFFFFSSQKCIIVSYLQYSIAVSFGYVRDLLDYGSNNPFFGSELEKKTDCADIVIGLLSIFSTAVSYYCQSNRRELRGYRGLQFVLCNLGSGADVPYPDQVHG